MYESKKLGQAGEEKAALYLQDQGYIILERNWRIGHKEIDIICTDGTLVVVVEVKSRKAGEERPAELMDYRKKRNLLRAGAAYLREKRLEKELRFDLIVVSGEGMQISHFKEAIQVFD